MSSISQPVEDQPVKLADTLPPESVIFGQSDGMLALRNRVQRVAMVHIPVLISGESGTGKEILARFIHLRSASAGGSFVKVSCPAISHASSTCGQRRRAGPSSR